MANSQTEKCPFPSKYSPGKWVTPAQYLTEIICERRAVKLETILPANFWELEVWQKFFQYQIRLVNQLLKKHSYDIVLSALQDSRWKHVWSFGNQQFCKALHEVVVKNQTPINTDYQHIPENKPQFHKNKWQDLKKKLSQN